MTKAEIWREGFAAAEGALGLNHTGVDLCPYDDAEESEPSIPVAKLQGMANDWRKRSRMLRILRSVNAKIQADAIDECAMQLEQLCAEAGGGGERVDE